MFAEYSTLTNTATQQSRCHTSGVTSLTTIGNTCSTATKHPITIEGLPIVVQFFQSYFSPTSTTIPTNASITINVSTIPTIYTTAIVTVTITIHFEIPDLLVYNAENFRNFHPFPTLPTQLPPAQSTLILIVMGLILTVFVTAAVIISFMNLSEIQL